MDSTSSSTANVLRFQAPPFLSEAWRRASSDILGPAEKLQFRIHFAELATRFLVAVLASESRGLGLEAPASLKDLIKRLERPTWGMWAVAARDLSRQLAGRADLVAPALAHILAGHEGAARVEEALDSLITTRNELAHDGHFPPGPDESAAALPRVDAALLEFGAALRVLRDVHILSVTETRQTYSGAWTSRILCFRGSEAAPRDIPARVDLPGGSPFLLATDGTALLLEPWIEVDTFGSSMPQARLLSNWKDEPLYADGVDGPARRSKRSGDAGQNAADFFAGCRPNRIPGAVPSDRVHEVLCGRTRDVRRPALEGYRYERVLGRGGAGTVHLAVAERSELPSRVAVKVLHPHLLDDARQAERFQREYEIAARLDVPGAVKVHYHATSPDCGPYIVMEYVEGERLDELRARHPIDLPVAGWIVSSLLGILHEAHKAGVVHRDVKPSNVILDDGGRVRLLDFGIGAALDMDRLTRTLDGVGTTHYAAPEQIRGGEANRRADLYSVGKVLAWLLTGDPSGSLDGVDPFLHAVIQQATRENPEERFQDAQEMARALDKALNKQGAGIAFHEGAVFGGLYIVQQVLGQAAKGVWAGAVAHRATGRAAGMLYAEAEGREELAKLAARRDLGLDIVGPHAGPGNQYYYAVVQNLDWERWLRQRVNAEAGRPPENAKSNAAIFAGALAGGMAMAAAAAMAVKKLGLAEKISQAAAEIGAKAQAARASRTAGATRAEDPERKPRG